MTHKHSGATLLTNQMLARSAYITITTASFATCYDDSRSRHPMVAGLSNFDLRSFMATATDINDRSKINWNTSVFMVIFHLGAIAALFMFSWRALLLMLLIWWVAGSLGVGMGFHRLLTHRGYKTPKAVEYFLTLCGLLALEGGAINWVVTHRIHHAHTERPGDPHTPRDGRWWAHMGWVLTGTSQQHPESVMRRYAPDLMKDSVHVWMNRLYFMPLVMCGIALFAVSGWQGVLWGVLFRVTFGLHATWLVNSA